MKMLSWNSCVESKENHEPLYDRQVWQILAQSGAATPGWAVSVRQWTALSFVSCSVRGIRS